MAPKKGYWNAVLLLLYTGLLFAGYFPFQCAIDPDGTSYLALAHRWAAGDYVQAVNGYWSPWSVWLTAGGLRLGLPESIAAIGQFAVGGGLFLGLSLGFIRRQKPVPGTLKVIEVCLLIFTVYAVYLQWFSDLWAAAFGLWGLQILENVKPRGLLKRAVFYGIAIALAYYSKSYYLPFFVLLTGVWLLHHAPLQKHQKALFSGGAALVALLLCAPWWAALYGKYNFFTTGTASVLNLSWGLLGHPIFGEGTLLLPPVYPNSPSYWEDPWRANMALVHFWDSPKMLKQQLLRSAYFTGRVLYKAALVTPLLTGVLLGNAVFLGCRLYQRKRLSFGASTFLLLFPAGMLLGYSEARYLWVLAPLVFVWLGERKRGFLNRHKKRLLLLAAFGLLLSPALDVPALMWNAGKSEKAFAAVLKERGIVGSFATAGPNAPTYAECLRLAHFSHVPYWPAAGPVLPVSEVLRAAPAVGISYLFLSAAVSPPAGTRLIHKNSTWQFLHLPPSPASPWVQAN